MSIVDDAGLGKRLGAGREADVYAFGDARVLKLYHPGFGGHRAEALTLRALEGRDVAPKLLDVVQRDGRPGLVLERLTGLNMMAHLERRPWHLRRVAAGRGRG